MKAQRKPGFCFSECLYFEFCLGLLLLVERTNLQGKADSLQEQCKPLLEETSFRNNSFRKVIYLHKYICAARMFELKSDFLLRRGWFHSLQGKVLKCASGAFWD